jgi:hypothetical protein
MAQSVQLLSYGLDDVGIVVLFPAGSSYLILLHSFWIDCSLIRPYVQCVCRGHNKRCVKLTTLIHRMSGLRMVVLYLQSWQRLHVEVLN